MAELLRWDVRMQIAQPGREIFFTAPTEGQRTRVITFVLLATAQKLVHSAQQALMIV